LNIHYTIFNLLGEVHVNVMTFVNVTTFLKCSGWHAKNVSGASFTALH